MRRFPWLQVILGVCLAVVILWNVPLSQALSSATVRFDGTYTAGGANTPFITCSLSKTSMTITRPKNGSATDTSILTCRNNLTTSVTLAPQSGLWTPGGGGAPSAGWSPTSMTIAGGSQATSTLTVSVVKQDNLGSYSYTFTVNETTTTSIMDYTRDMSVAVTVN